MEQLLEAITGRADEECLIFPRGAVETGRQKMKTFSALATSIPWRGTLGKTLGKQKFKI
jgi:hypothetical protein